MVATVLGVLALTGTAAATPPAPTITEPATDGQLVHPADVHMEVARVTDPNEDACTDWEIRTPDLARLVWQAPCATGVLAFHIHLGDGTFAGTKGGRPHELDFGTDYVVRARFHDEGGEIGDWSIRHFSTYPPSSPGGEIAWTSLQPGYVID